ncbi:MAG: hypothetical protein KF725_01250 [Cyclobacteriaceae bacterium]|nr:hypothetical protein [Cyclobacteriaceae bacterium]UYN86919.1 MAG: hypothetical protein KIT51_01155 [Cyclobacteriaceae bacterium]
MKNNLMMRWLSRFFVAPFLLATLLLVSCGDDPEPPNEEELITTLIVTLTSDGGSPVTLKFYDPDGSGPEEGQFTYTPIAPGTSPAALLAMNTTYLATIQLLDESKSPTEDITEEIEEEADEHLFCFMQNVSGMTISYADTEADYLSSGSLPVGLKTTWSTTTAGSGTVQITLRHQPGVKNGTCPGGGDTDIEVTFNVVVQ